MVLDWSREIIWLMSLGSQQLMLCGWYVFPFHFYRFFPLIVFFRAICFLTIADMFRS